MKTITVKNNIDILMTILVLYSLPLCLIIETFHLFGFTVGKMSYRSKNGTPVIEWLDESDSRKKFWGACGLISTVLYVLLFICYLNLTTGG